MGQGMRKTILQKEETTGSMVILCLKCLLNNQRKMPVFCLSGICGTGIQRRSSGLASRAFTARGNKKVKRSPGEHRMGRYYEVGYSAASLFMTRASKTHP